MTLKYDFDMCPGTEGTPIAMFRDRQTVEALRGAEPEVQGYFIASGFGLNVFHSGYAPDLYPARDMTARLAVIERLSANLGVFDLGGREMNGFDFGAFLTHLETTRPAGDPAPRAVAARTHARGTERVAAVLGILFLTMVYVLFQAGGALASL